MLAHGAVAIARGALHRNRVVGFYGVRLSGLIAD